VEPCEALDDVLTIDIWKATGEPSGYAPVRDDGTFGFSLSGPGDYVLEVGTFFTTTPVPITVTQNQILDLPPMTVDCMRHVSLRLDLGTGPAAETFKAEDTVVLYGADDTLSTTAPNDFGVLRFQWTKAKPPYGLRLFYADNFYVFEDVDVVVSVDTDPPVSELPVLSLPKGQISGRTIQLPESPLANVTLRLISLTSRFSYKTISEASGQFLFDGVEPGEYHLFIIPSEQALAVAVMEGVVLQDNEEVDLGNLGIDFGATVRGTVSETGGAPYPGATVTLAKGVEILPLSARSAPDGSYEINQVPAGDYVATVRGPEGQALAGPSVTVSPQQVLSGIDFNVPDVVGEITGVVRDSVSSLPLSGVLVSAVNTANGAAANDTSDVNGAYALENLPPGQYAVMAWLEGYTYVYLEGFDLSGPNTTLEVDVVLEAE
jgi:hypothetical protein